MQVLYSRTFDKRFEKLPRKKQIHVTHAIELFLTSSTDPKLRLHELSGALQGVWSISAGGDLRIHFEYVEGGFTILFLTVGTHAQLYG